MKLFCNGVEFPAEVTKQRRKIAPGDDEIPVFEATATKPFPVDAKWEIEDDGARVELSIRRESVAPAPAGGGYSASFTAPAVG